MSASLESAISQARQARREERLSDAKQLFASAVALARNQTDNAHLAAALTGLGQIERDLKEIVPALTHYREAAALYRELSDSLQLAHTIRHIADILRGEHHLAEARPYYEEALSIYRTHTETPPLDLANALRGFALLSEAMAEIHTAPHLWQQARDLYAAVDVQPGVAECDARISRLAGPPR